MPATPNTTISEPKNSFQVLIVDDHDDNRAMLQFALERRGIGVIEATDGIEAIKMACLKRPDVILMDISMPVMDGLESVRQLKGVELTRSIPVVVLSAHCGDPLTNKKAMDAGCIGCVSKPFDLKELVALIESFRIETSS